MWGESLTPEQENQILEKLRELAKGGSVLTAKELKKLGFASWLETLLNTDVGYEGALQNRVLQELRNRGRITMNHGYYIITG